MYLPGHMVEQCDWLQVGLICVCVCVCFCSEHRQQPGVESEQVDP